MSSETKTKIYFLMPSEMNDKNEKHKLIYQRLRRAVRVE